MPEITNRDPDLEIDFLDIPTAVGMQSSLYGYYGELAVDARAERDSAVNLLDKRTAEVELEIRKRAADTGEKMTESKVSALVEANSELADLKADVVEKNRALQKLETKVRALEHKRSMVESAVRLVVSKSMGLSNDGVTDAFAESESTRAIRDGLNRR